MIKIILWALLIVALIIISPVISIWALNTLFKLNIEFSFWTWLALAWLQTICFTRLNNSKS